ncbi:hypothetical protein DICPUDRAFT_92268 [Dictyostelium purpureum]|uniref:Secreted protein n=1 Tax=Dictyostelium purpureum TaxID=5786 RepID=F0ZPB6_DICPU|nr:uncharacterized protein DICPUDRAFT_92268 [Dictyostelium purpureum]EGC34215.1 hypothetical protein DICPUDRAFT_92268 [Dictyostelium purpureum]|eukprot:XP_003289267.1 hypothetical protein DICPUDRAFT_92268 [Dictyostelium purpureum]
MRIFITLLLIFGLFSSSFAVQPQQVELENLQSTKDFGKFLVGFAEGLEISLSGHLKSCIASIDSSFADLSAAYHNIDSGFSHKSSSTMRAGLRDFGHGILDVYNAYNRCGVKSLISDIRTIAAEVSSETGILKLVIHEGIDIIHNAHTLTTSFKNMISDCKRGDFTGCGVNSGRIVGILIHQ